jgi:hypothetical protein
MVVDSFEREHRVGDVLAEKSSVSGVFGEGWAGVGRAERIMRSNSRD